MPFGDWDEDLQWTADGHTVWYEDGYGFNLEHPASCDVTETYCGCENNGNLLYRHFDESIIECPNPVTVEHPDCTLTYEVDAVGLVDWLDEEQTERLKELVSHHPSTPTPIRYFLNPIYTPSTYLGPEEWDTEWDWEPLDLDQERVVLIRDKMVLGDAFIAGSSGKVRSQLGGLVWVSFGSGFECVCNYGEDVLLPYDAGKLGIEPWAQMVQNDEITAKDS